MAVSAQRAFHGAVIRARRERALLSQEELAERSGLSVRTIRNIETERVTRPHPKTMQLICVALTEAEAPYAETDEQTRSPNGVVPVPHQLSADITDFSGRHRKIEQVCEVLAQFLLSLGVDDVAIPAGLDDRAALYRTLLDRRQILVLLDNAADEAQV